MKQEDSLHALELRISYLLRYGVLLAGLFLFIGWMVSLVTHGDLLSTFSVYTPVSLPETTRIALAANDWGKLTALFGLGLLVTLPVVRVLLTGFLFLKEKDYLLAVLAFVVFAVLIASFSLGIEL